MSEIKLDMHLKQTVRVSPQMLQATRILQMNAQELHEYVDQVMAENPLLDKAPEHEGRQELQRLSQEVGWLSGGGVRTGLPNEAHCYSANGVREPALASLSAFLSDQLDRRALHTPLRELCMYLVEALDEDGFLEQADIDAAEAMGVPNALLRQAVTTLQGLEPAGVAARSLQECLLLQLRRMPQDTALAECIVKDHLPLLGKKQWHALAERLSAPEEDVRCAAALIRSLSPHPWCGETAQPTPPEYIIPDVFVVEQHGELQTILNDFYVPNVQINSYYAALLTETEEQKTRDFLRQKMQQAQWLLTHMEQRRKTLLRCAQLIAEAHLPFFRGETPYLVPLTQKEAAARLDMHASTVSRCIRGKYLQCRQGTFPLQYFFPRPVDERGCCSEQAVRTALARHLRDEDPAHPLSDRQLGLLLAEEGFPAARRTVAKYRQLLGIPPAYGRKK